MRRLSVRLLPAVLYVVLAVVLLVRNGVPLSDDMQIAWVVGGLLCASVAAGGNRARRLFLDWLPLAAVLTAYDVLRGIGGGRVPIHSQEQIRFSRALFRTEPVVWLQRELWSPLHIHWYDYAAWTVYLSYYFATILVLAVLWWRRPALFRRYVLLLVGLWVVALLFFTGAPTIPPWLASQKGLIGPVTRLIGPIGRSAPGLLNATPVWDRGVRLANDLAAFPSLHEAMTLLLSLFFWSRARLWVRALLVLYPLAMAFTLLYTGEHYVLDLLGGAALAVAVVAAERRLTRRLVPRLAVSPRLATLLAWVTSGS